MVAVTTTATTKKCVRFDAFVNAAYFEKASRDEALSVWFQASELEAIKTEFRTIAESYRNKLDVTTDTGRELSVYRGAENCTATRIWRRLVSNSAAIAAHGCGASDVETAALYRSCNGWSSEVALVQAVYDHAESYNGDRIEDDIIESALDALPLVASMVPPALSPRVIEIGKLFQRQKKRNAAVCATEAAIKYRRVKRRLCQ